MGPRPPTPDREPNRWRRGFTVAVVLFAFSALFQLLSQIGVFRSFESFVYPWDGAVWLFAEGLLSVATVAIVQRVAEHSGASPRYPTVLVVSLIVFVPLSVSAQVLVERFVFEKGHTWYTILRYAAFRTTWHLIVANGFIAYRYLSALGRVRVRLATAERDRAEMKLRQLQRSVSPHFLFNSLNILHALIDDDPQRAAEFTTRLAEMYRYIVRHQDAEVVTLVQELSFARDYAYLLEQRFGRAWSISMPELDHDPGFLVVPTAIQSLVENAVKHNIARESEPLRVEVRIDDQRLVVANDRRPKTAKGVGTGLALLRARYARLDDRPVLVEPSAAQFRVTLPLIRSV